MKHDEEVKQHQYTILADARRKIEEKVEKKLQRQEAREAKKLLR